MATVPLLDAAVAAVLPAMVAFRHDVHAHPEPGFEEVRTLARVQETLTAAGVTGGAVMATTGYVVDIAGTGPPRQPSTSSSSSDSNSNSSSAPPTCIALRADMDALRMTEGQNALPYRSTNDNAAHMCGHDGHMAALLGAATLIANARDRLPTGTSVRLLFQPAEEGPGGAPPMIEAGCLNGVDEVYGHHNWPTVPVGVVAVVPGPTMAHVTEFMITIVGKGGHASQPHATLDPVVTAAHVITALQTIVSRSCHSRENAVLTVAAITAGTAFNIIPDKAVLKGTIRDLSKDVSDLINKRLVTIVNSTCEAFGCKAEIEITDLYPVLINHVKETEHVRRVAARVVGAQNVTTGDLPIMGAEDFAYFLQHRPGCFFFLGGKEAGRTNAMCHSTQYDYNDNVLPIGIAMWVRLVEDRFGVTLYN